MRTWIIAALVVVSAPAFAQPAVGCSALPDHAKLRAALQSVVKQGQASNTGLGNQEWAAVVNRDGVVCAIVFSGPDRGSQWPGSRVIAAEKASTANALSGPNFALSTGNLYAAVQPGGPLYSLISAAPPNADAVFGGKPEQQGQPDDPMVGKPIGGLITFAGGLALYDAQGKIVGGLGVSGDTSCADHVVAWKLRHELKLDAVPMGVAPDQTDNLILDFKDGHSDSGYGHPGCKGGKPSEDAITKLPKDFPKGIGPKKK